MTAGEMPPRLKAECATLPGLGRAATWAEVGEKLRRFAADCDGARAIHLSLRPDPQGRGGLLQVTTLGGRGHGLLSEGRMIAHDDPLALMCEASGPHQWTAEGDESEHLAEVVAGLGIAREELRRGWALPIRGPGRVRGLFAATSARESLLDGRGLGRLLEPWLSVFGWEFHRSVVELLDRADETRVRVPPREVAVLAAAAAGRTARQTAAELGLSTDTVEGYLRDAVKRLGCINKTHAVAVAVRRGLI